MDWLIDFGTHIHHLHHLRCAALRCAALLSLWSQPASQFCGLNSLTTTTSTTVLSSDSSSFSWVTGKR